MTVVGSTESDSPEKRISMFAVVALICFVLSLFHAHLGGIDFTVLGLAFVAAHLAFSGWTAWGPWRGRQNP